MAEELDDEERELLAKHRAKKAKQRPGRKVTVRGKHDSGAEYSFDLDGDEAERVISRHRALWADEDGPEDDGGGEDEGEEDTSGEGGEEGGQARPRARGRAAAGSAAAPGGGQARKGPYFKR
jgi:hypothetical protein